MQPVQAAAYCIYLQTILTLQGSQNETDAGEVLDELLERVGQQSPEWVQEYVAQSERLRAMPTVELMAVLPDLIGFSRGGAVPS